MKNNKEITRTKEKDILRNEQGITLVALIITIIVLVILAVVSIAAVYNSKIVEYAINGAQDYTTQAVNENQIMRGTEGIIQNGIDRINQIVNQGEEGLEPGVDPEPENNVPTTPEVAFVSAGTNTITFKAKSTDPDGDKITYTIYLGTDQNNLNLSQSFAENNSGEEVTLTTSTDKCNLTDYTDYYWKVVASDGKLTGNIENSPLNGLNKTVCGTCQGNGNAWTRPCGAGLPDWWLNDHYTGSLNLVGKTYCTYCKKRIYNRRNLPLSRMDLLHGGTFELRHCGKVLQ